MITTGKSLMFLEFHMTGDTKETRYGIIATKTLLRDTIAEIEVRVYFVHGKEERQSKHNRTLEGRNSLGVCHKVTQMEISCEW